MSIDERKEKAIFSVNSCFFDASIVEFDVKRGRRIGGGQLTDGK